MKASILRDHQGSTQGSDEYSRLSMDCARFFEQRGDVFLARRRAKPDESAVHESIGPLRELARASDVLAALEGRDGFIAQIDDLVL